MRFKQRRERAHSLKKNSVDMDHQTEKFDYDAARYRLPIVSRMGKHRRDPLGLDIHNFIRHTSRCQRVERMCDLASSIEHICRHFQEVGEATDEKAAKPRQRLRSGAGGK